MHRPLIAGLACVALAVVACGDDDGTSADGTAPPTTAASQKPATDAGDAPERIVSMAPTATEIVFAVGAGEQVVAVDEQSDFPAGVPVTDLSAYEPNVEAVLTYEPDLVITAGDVPAELLDGLESAGVEVLALPAPASLDEVYEQFADVGIATGHEDEAADLVARVRGEIDDLVATVPDRVQAPTYYHELDNTLYSVTSSTFIGQIYALAGLANVADAADPNGDFSGYPQLSAEYLVQADPDVVFLADTECCGQSAETLAARPGFAGLSAVANGRVVELSDDVASRWGPRIVDLLGVIVDATADVPA
jgi:iron complex transport system substrate-binding protein